MIHSLTSLRRWSAAILAIGLACVFSGCTTVVVNGDTTAEYKFGELQTFVENDFADVYAAAKAGLADRKLFLTGDDKKVVEAVLTARDSADTSITIKIKEVAKGSTSIKIRYGLTGELAPAQLLYKAIESRL